MKKVLIFTTAMVFTVSAYALTLKEKKELAYWNEEAVEVIASVNKKCDTNISFSLDENFAKPFMEANATAIGYCDNAMDGITRLCDSDDLSKSAVQESIKAVQCVYNPEKGDISYSLSDGTFTMNIGLDAANVGDKTKEFLENNL